MTATSAREISRQDPARATRRAAFYRRWVGPLAAYLVMTAIALVVMIPLFWMISTSLKERWEIFAYPPEWIPSDPQWQNYREAFTPWWIVMVGSSTHAATQP